MAALFTFPPIHTAETAWGIYIKLVREAGKNPLLFEDEAHTRARRAAHAAFQRAFEEMEGRQ